jgi:hypothetical protein
MSFNKAVEESPISLVTFYVWLKANIELEKSYNYAREIRADVLFEEIIDIADTTEDGVITTEKATGIEVRTGDMEGHRRLKIDARKWVVSKMLPKKYGEKLDITSKGEELNKPTTELIFTKFEQNKDKP